jgi:hypothetical protein
MSTTNLDKYSGLMIIPSHTRLWQSIYGTMSFCKMNLNQKPRIEDRGSRIEDRRSRIERKIKVSRLQTMQLYRYLKWCHLHLFARSLDNHHPSDSCISPLDEIASLRPDGIELDSQQTLGSSETGSGHHVEGVTGTVWVHETSFVEVYYDARRGLILSFYLSIFLSFYLSIFLYFYISIFLYFYISIFLYF